MQSCVETNSGSFRVCCCPASIPGIDNKKKHSPGVNGLHDSETFSSSPNNNYIYPWYNNGENERDGEGQRDFIRSIRRFTNFSSLLSSSNRKNFTLYDLRSDLCLRRDIFWRLGRRFLSWDWIVIRRHRIAIHIQNLGKREKMGNNIFLRIIVPCVLCALCVAAADV